MRWSQGWPKAIKGGQKVPRHEQWWAPEAAATRLLPEGAAQYLA
jgi:hypothetical protein